MRNTWAFFLFFSLSGIALAIETPDYQIIDTLPDSVEVRKYAGATIASTIVASGIRESGNIGFRRLAGYIFGDNELNKKIKMTAPVMQQRKSEESYEVVFFLPRDLSAPPRPSNRDVLIKNINMEVAVLAYKGGWKVKTYEENLETLKSRLADNEKWKISGDPIWARYDPPWMPSFLRSNEIMLPVVRR